MSGRAISHKDMNGLKILNLGAATTSTDGVNKGQLDADITGAKARANHTGTQTASTISDFDTQVRSSTLNQMTAPSADLSMNTHKITNVVDPTGAQDAATKAYVDTTFAGLTTGLVIKGSATAAVTSNVNISSPGATLDGVTASNGQTYLLTGQTTASANGPYIYNGSGSAMTRSPNWDSDAEATLGSFWIVQQGTKADQFAVLTNDSAITLGTTNLTFAFITTGSGGVTSYTTTCPNVSAGASWTITHNLGGKGFLANMYRSGSPFDDLDYYGERTDNNTYTVKPDVALSSGDVTIVLAKVI